ncbi:MAG: zinc ABC transporter substrate-binding protein [Planctomycetota bacterium]
MPPILAHFAPLTACLLLLSTLAGCGGNTVASSGAQSGKLSVVATTGQVGDLVRNVAGDSVDLVVLMGPSVDPHLYKEKPSDIQQIDSADLVFYNGLHFEGGIAETLEQMSGSRPVFAVTEKLEEGGDARIRYPSGRDAFPDPHVWHDARVWADCALHVAERLAEIDPSGAERYRKNAATYHDQLLEVDNYCRAQVATLPEERRVLVTTHDAFAYLSEAYGLESVGMKGISTSDELALDRIEEVAQLVIERKLPAVFVESSNSDRIIEALIEPCLAAGHSVTNGGSLYADALGPEGSGAETYLGMMRKNIDTIVTALGGE